MPLPTPPADIPYAQVADGAVRYATLDEAMRSVFQQVRDISAAGKNEYAGAFIKGADGQFAYTNPIAGSNDEFKYRLQIPKGSSLAAIYHGHPAEGELSQRFSQNDLETIRSLNVPSYILNMGNSKIGMMTPEQAARIRPRDVREGNTKLLGDVLGELSKPNPTTK